jgi:CHAT domain-containing protein
MLSQLADLSLSTENAAMFQIRLSLALEKCPNDFFRDSHRWLFYHSHWRPLGPGQVASQLPNLTKQTVLSYALLPQGLAVWVYDSRGVFGRWSEENPADIETKAERFRRLCSDPNSDLSDLQRSARALYDLLVAPIEFRLAPDRALVIELDERLSRLPFDALLDARGHYLSERGPITSSLGIYYLRNSSAAVNPITADSIALVAAVAEPPVIDNQTLTPLPDVALEGEMVAHSFHSALLLSAAGATTASVLARLPDVAVFHFAGHAISSQQHSGILLSDALLTASSLEKLRLPRLRLVVFSACDTQAGATGSAYDQDSLVRVFLRRGVPEIVASAWNVDSDATQRFMGLFYGALLGGNTTANAIRQAQAGLRSQRGMAHPYYWSAFTAFGSG